MNRERLQYLAHLVIVTLGAAAFAIIFLRYVFAAVLPFMLAWLAALASERPARYLSGKVRVPKRVLRLLVAAAVTFVAVALLLLFGRLVIGQLWSLLSGLGEGDSLGKIISGLSEQMLGIFGRLELPGELEESIRDALSGVVGSVLSSLGSALTGVVSRIPGIFLFVTVTLIAVIYFALDLERVNSAVKGILPSRVTELLSRMKRGALTLAGKYLRSYFLIMLITFGVMLSGLFVLGVEYAFICALMLALLDLLPVIGVGTALVPASVFCFVSGNRTLAIGLLVLFAVNEVIRQLAEPRILGKNLGVHPLATLAAVYAGYSFFGLAGILLLPLLVLFIGIYKNNASKVA